MEEEKVYDIKISLKKQKQFQVEKNCPNFLPQNGRCWKCGKNVFEKYENNYSRRTFFTGIDTKRAGEELFTGCPHCNKSYCD